MKSLPNENEFNMSHVHGPYIPENIRENELIKAEVIVEGASLVRSYRVWRISPLGLELYIGDNNNLEIQKGSSVSVKLFLGKQETFFKGLVVDSIIDESNKQIAHIRLVNMKSSEKFEGERRKSSRWLCGSEFFPTGIAPNPVRFNDFIYFKIEDISYGGFKLIASLRNKFLISGITLDSMINFPMVSQVNVKVKINNVKVESQNGKDVLAIGATYSTSDNNVNKVVSNYLLQFSNADSLSEIKDSGFLSETISETVNYTYVKTKEEFEEVLKLRYLSYKEAGKVEEGKTYMDMSDQYDAKSRIVIGKLKGEIICSARIIFHQLGDKLEQEQFVQWPVDMPRQDEVVEIMRACTKPGFRGSDLLLGMFKFMSITVAQAKKNWIVICATNEMVPFYSKIGFKNIGLSYLHKKLNNIEHHIMVANFIDGMSGKSVNPIYWNIVWSDSVDYMSEYDLINLDPLMQIRVSFYKWFKPLANFFVQKKFKQKQNKILSKK